MSVVSSYIANGRVGSAATTFNVWTAIAESWKSVQFASGRSWHVASQPGTPSRVSLMKICPGMEGTRKEHVAAAAAAVLFVQLITTAPCSSWLRTVAGEFVWNVVDHERQPAIVPASGSRQSSDSGLCG